MHNVQRTTHNAQCTNTDGGTVFNTIMNTTVLRHGVGIATQCWYWQYGTCAQHRYFNVLPPGRLPIEGIKGLAGGAAGGEGGIVPAPRLFIQVQVQVQVRQAQQHTFKAGHVAWHGMA
jgi:hypothetical protein